MSISFSWKLYFEEIYRSTNLSSTWVSSPLSALNFHSHFACRKMEIHHSIIATQPLINYKVLHLVRHAEGVHNVEAQKNRTALMSAELLDAQLSPLGWEQVADLRKHIRSTGLLNRVDLIITSPMLRTLQTAVGLFDTKDDEVVIAENGHQSLPILAIELCRERLGIEPCNRRSSISHYQSLFPEIDFSLIESEDDNLWSADVRESFEEITTRGIKFIEWLKTRKEKEIAVVSHGIFLQQTLIALIGNMRYSGVTQSTKRFSNCEVRSVVLVDENAMKTDYLTSSCCERIPQGLPLVCSSAHQDPI